MQRRRLQRARLRDTGHIAGHGRRAFGLNIIDSTYIERFGCASHQSADRSVNWDIPW